MPKDKNPKTILNILGFTSKPVVGTAPKIIKTKIKNFPEEDEWAGKSAGKDDSLRKLSFAEKQKISFFAANLIKNSDILYDYFVNQDTEIETLNKQLGEVYTGIKNIGEFAKKHNRQDIYLQMKEASSMLDDMVDFLDKSNSSEQSHPNIKKNLQGVNAYAYKVRFMLGIGKIQEQRNTLKTIIGNSNNSQFKGLFCLHLTSHLIPLMDKEFIASDEVIGAMMRAYDSVAGNKKPSDQTDFYNNILYPGNDKAALKNENKELIHAVRQVGQLILKSLKIVDYHDVQIRGK